ncbi:hypothetical protein PLEOSDRAFT_158550 [Pleurotus ostreatus PC15]|uniref:Uncharacterized protein n=1 Tax=Pleurotus ostreatus (strain PC15) TaxID=1137138 RepID=A0A067NVC2_PLEO1|nr:hypothetical protein PLEOSDRAFT_158550 [Pleurotus ostreatus PC15]
MDQLKKLFKKHSQKEKELARRKQVRRSRSLPLRELDKENALKPILHSKQFLQPGVEFLDSPIGEIPFILQSDFILDICPAGAMDIDTEPKEIKRLKKPLMKILDDFPVPPPTPVLRKGWASDATMPKDKYELSKLCGLPPDDLLPPNPYAPWIPPSSTITQRRPAQTTSGKHNERTFTRAPASRGIYGNARACHSTMTLCSTSRLPLVLEPPAPLKIRRRVAPSSAPAHTAVHEQASSKAPRSTPLSPPVTSREQETRAACKPMPKGRVPVDVQEADGMWASSKSIHMNASRFS